MKNKFFLSTIMAMSIILSGIGMISARSWTENVTFTNIPGGGSFKTGNKTNTKDSNDEYASFYTKSQTSTLVCGARITSTSESPRSQWARLRKGDTTYAGIAGATNGGTYKCQVKTNNIEWSNDTDVTVHFTADRLIYN